MSYRHHTLNMFKIIFLNFHRKCPFPIFSPMCVNENSVLSLARRKILKSSLNLPFTHNRKSHYLYLQTVARIQLLIIPMATTLAKLPPTLRLLHIFSPLTSCFCLPLFPYTHFSLNPTPVGHFKIEVKS